MKKYKVKYIGIVFFPIILGSLIYLFYRKPSMLLFEWIDKIGFLSFLFFIRSKISCYLVPPDWFVYNLPGGLWIYSFTSLIILIGGIESFRENIIPITVPIFLALLSEIIQYLNQISGTFDIFDIFFYIFFYLFALIQFKIISIKWRIYEI